MSEKDTISDAVSGLRMVLIGPPGAVNAEKLVGKGTQAQHIKDSYHLCHLETGAMLRAQAAQDTELGNEVKGIMNSGGLVSDEIMINMIAKEMAENPDCQNGFILDGFPRTTAQAEKLDALLESKDVRLGHVIELCVSNALLVKRITGRLIHPGSGRVYHETDHPPKVPMKDDVTGEPLIRRSDDNAEALEKRLQTYTNMTAPVVEYYKKQGIWSPIDAAQTKESVWASLSTILASNTTAAAEPEELVPESENM